MVILANFTAARFRQNNDISSSLVMFYLVCPYICIYDICIYDIYICTIMIYNNHHPSHNQQCEWRCLVNSSPSSAAYMRQWTRTALVQVMTCRLFGAKSLPEPMLTYCQLNPQKQISVKYESKYKTFNTWQGIWKRGLWNSGHFVLGKMS